MKAHYDAKGIMATIEEKDHMHTNLECKISNAPHSILKIKISSSVYNQSGNKIDFRMKSSNSPYIGSIQKPTSIIVDISEKIWRRFLPKIYSENAVSEGYFSGMYNGNMLRMCYDFERKMRQENSIPLSKIEFRKLYDFDEYTLALFQGAVPSLMERY